MSQRTIKFRAWDKINKKMTPSFDFRQWEGNKLYLSNYGVLYYGDLIILEFTGVEDRNKKEIFEGNLLEIQEHYCGDNKYPKGIFKVIYKDAEFFATSKLEKYVSLFDATKNFNAVVIGNIYENKNLLKEEL